MRSWLPTGQELRAAPPAEGLGSQRAENIKAPPPTQRNFSGQIKAPGTSQSRSGVFEEQRGSCSPAEPRRNSEPWLQDTSISLPRKLGITTQPRSVSGERNIPSPRQDEEEREHTGSTCRQRIAGHFHQWHVRGWTKSLCRFLKLFLQSQLPKRNRGFTPLIKFSHFPPNRQTATPTLDTTIEILCISKWKAPVITKITFTSSAEKPKLQTLRKAGI